MSGNYWGKYLDDEPNTHFDPLQSFIENDRIIGFRVNFVPGRSKRPREQHIKLSENINEEEITREEIKNSPLNQVIEGIEPAIVIAADEEILSLPDEDAQTNNYSKYRGLSIMNKFSPLGINSAEAHGVAMVNFPTTYTRTLDEPLLNYNLMVPMRESMKFIVGEKRYRNNLNTPLIFFNIGPSSGASIRFLHAQSYAVKESQGLNSYAFERAHRSNQDCLGCKIANEESITDHLGQEINYHKLTVWEDDNIRIIYPYAPVRTMGTRLIFKRHVSYIGELSNRELQSLAIALSIADYVMNAVVNRRRKVIRDRTVTFRQTPKFGEDFHMFIDILPPFPFVAAETVDFLGLSPYKPSKVAKWMREISIDQITQKIKRN